VKDEEVARTLRRTSETLFSSTIQHTFNSEAEQSLQQLESDLDQLRKSK
jgi:hypothetical protein